MNLHRFTNFIVQSLLMVVFIWAPASKADTKRSFTIYDATLYSGKPTLSKYGIDAIDVIYDGNVYSKGGNTDALPTQTQIDNSLKHLTTKDALVVLDFEGWHIQGHSSDPDLMKSNGEKYYRLLQMYKKSNPNRKYGFFGVLPPGNFTASLASVDSRQFEHWQDDNLRLLPLAESIDAAFPEAYTYTSSKDDWLNSLQMHLLQLRKIYSGPVYVFIWPQYFDHAPATEDLRLKYIPAGFWRFQLEQLSQLVDGAIIWGGWDFEKRNPSNWNENAEWWQETKAFLSARKAQAAIDSP
jgi:hypothetical protein